MSSGSDSERLAPVTPFTRAGRSPASPAAGTPAPVDAEGWYIDATSPVDAVSAEGVPAEPAPPEASDPQAAESIAPVIPLDGARRRAELDWGAWRDADDPEAPAAAPVRLRPAEGLDDFDDPDEPDEPHPDTLVEAYSMAALARRAYARRELAELLEAKGVTPEVAEEECQRLERVGLVDDVTLAGELVDRLQRRKGMGKAGLGQELRQRKLDPLAIEQALSLLDSDDELQRALEAAAKRVGSLASLEPEAARRRLGGFLQRRGYDSGTVSRAVEIALRGSRNGLGRTRTPGGRGDGSGPRFRP